jgi:cephalosporin hydroxylase
MIKVDLENGTVSVEADGVTTTHRLDTAEAFNVISDVWLRAGWDNKYVYSFTWLGRPIIQLPEDMFRLQELIHSLRPDVIVETGVAHGGSLVFYASLCKATERGRVIGVDIEIRPHNRAAIESHLLAPLITLIEGSSIEPAVVESVRSLIAPGEKSARAAGLKSHEATRAQRTRGLCAAGHAGFVHRRNGRDHGKSRGRTTHRD